MNTISEKELVALIRFVFPPLPDDRALAILIDFPRARSDDHSDWRKRRQMAHSWCQILQRYAGDLDLQRVQLVGYERVTANNADLPKRMVLLTGALPETADGLIRAGERVETHRLFRDVQLFLVPSEYSATAPLKLAAKKHHFRAATMPGFNEKMLPALRLDWTEVGRRLDLLKKGLDAAELADIEFAVKEGNAHRLLIDLRHRKATISSGRFPERDQVGNLPSGETYIVPYEGEKEPESRSQGSLPVQFGDEVVVYEIERNRARRVVSQGAAAKKEAQALEQQPAYGNLAELGFGVLRDLGVRPVDQILLDEKLGLHIAFGRSDHFGGFVGPAQFTSPSALVHIDRIYIPECQPRIVVKRVALQIQGGDVVELMRDGQYLIF